MTQQIARCTRTLLARLAMMRVANLGDEALQSRVFTHFWSRLYPRTDVSATAKLLLYWQLRDAGAQLARPDDARDGRQRLRAYLTWAMLQHIERDVRGGLSRSLFVQTGVRAVEAARARWTN